MAPLTDLFIFSDGPKTPGAEFDVQNVRKLIKSIDGFKSVTIFESEINNGLAASIINGVSNLLTNNDFVIVVEDDIVTSPYFLNYMNRAKVEYLSNEKVMHVSGYMYPIKTEGLPDTFFLCQATCWGWGTWRRAWNNFEKKPTEALNYIRENNLKKSFNLENSYDFLDQIEKNISGEINTWAIFWYLCLFKNSGLGLHPKVSYCQNIGNDGSGQHSGRTKNFNVEINLQQNLLLTYDIKEHYLAKERLITFNKKIKQNIVKKLLLKVRKLVFKK